MGTEGERPSTLTWADLVCRTAHVGVAGSLDEEVAMGIERRQQGDTVSINQAKCACVQMCVCCGWGV